MKKLFFAIIAFAGVSLAQAAPHSATLTWADTLNPTGTTYSVYRSSGLCSGTPVYSKLATAVTVKTYQDSTVQPGNYCFTVTATFNGMESAQATPAGAAVPSFAPTGLTILTVQVFIPIPYEESAIVSELS